MESNSKSHIVTYGVCGIIACLNLAMIWNFSSPFPFRDDWGNLQNINHVSELDASWIMEKEAGNFFKPVPRTVMMLCFKFFDGDLRYGLVIQFIPLIIASFYILYCVQKHASGKTFLAIAVPISMMSLGNLSTSMWFTASFCSLQTAIVSACAARFMFGGPLKRPNLALFLLLILGSIQGVSGVVLLTPFAFLAFCQALWPMVGTAENPKHRGLAVFLGVLWIAATLLICISASEGGYPGQTELNVKAILQTCVEFQSMSLGIVSRKIWPLSGIIILSALAGCIYVSISSSRNWNDFLGSKFIDLFCILPVPLISLLFGVARATQGGLVSRYAAYAIPLYVACYLFFMKHRHSSKFSEIVHFALFLVPISAFWFDAQSGLSDARNHRQRWSQLEEDLMSEMSAERLFARNSVANQDFGWFSQGVEILKQSGLPAWRNVPDTKYDETVLDLSALKPSHLKLIDGEWVSQGSNHNPELRFAFENQKVDLIRLEFILKSKSGSTNLRARWIPENGECFDLSEQAVTVHFNTAKAAREVETIFIDIKDTTNAVAISPGSGQYQFELISVSLLKESM